MSMACDYCGGDIRSDCHAPRGADNPVLTRYVAQLRADRAVLLEALETAVSTLETCDAPETANEGDLQFWLERQHHAITQARAAIAQAKGDI